MHDNSDFKMGDLVQLRSGGPLMTVAWCYNVETDKPLIDEVTNNFFVKTIWFDNNGHERVNVFDIRILTKR